MNGFNNFKGQEEGPQTTTVPIINNHDVCITIGSLTLHPFICVLSLLVIMCVGSNSCALGRDIKVKKAGPLPLVACSLVKESTCQVSTVPRGLP